MNSSKLLTTLKKFSKKIFTNKYTDLVVILMVLLSITFLALEHLSGFVITEKVTAQIKEKGFEQNKIDIIRQLENKKFSEDKLENLLKNKWFEIEETAFIYGFSSANTEILKKLLSNYSNETIKKITETVKGRNLSKNSICNLLDSNGIDEATKITILMEITPFPQNLEKNNTFSDKQIYIFKSLKTQKWQYDDLQTAIDANNWEIIKNHLSEIKFTENEISIIKQKSQLFFPISEKQLNFIIASDDIFIAFFLIELFLRYFACLGFKDFLWKHWIDILAIIPLLRIFRLSRYLLLLRLIRPLAYTILMARRMSFFSLMAKRKWLDLVAVVFVFLLVIVFGAIILNASEPERHTLSHSFWTIIFSLFSNQYTDDFPDTLTGKFTILFAMIVGMGFFAIVIGAVSAFMIQKFKEGLMMNTGGLELLEEHVIICGWEDITPQIIKELQSDEKYKRSRNIVIISDDKDFTNTDLNKFDIDPSCIYLIEGDFTDPEILQKARIKYAEIAIILPDWTEGRSKRDIDARTVLTALTIEKLNPDVYSCAVILDKEYESHMRMGQVNEIIIGDYYNGLITAHAAHNKNLVPFIQSIIPSKAAHKLSEKKICQKYIGKKFESILTDYRKEYKNLPVGIKNPNGKMLINPSDYTIAENDIIIFIGDR